MTEVIFVQDGQLNRSVEVPSGEKAEMVLLVLPGVSCDVRLDIRLVGEGAEANVYGAYVCGADERVKIAVDMHHDVPHCNSPRNLSGRINPMLAGRARKQTTTKNTAKYCCCRSCFESHGHVYGA